MPGGSFRRGKSEAVMDRLPGVPAARSVPPRTPMGGDEVLYCHHFDGRDIPTQIVEVIPEWRQAGHWILIRSAAGTLWSLRYDATGYDLDGWRFA